MPVMLLERLPLPSLRTYTCISVALLAVAVYYSYVNEIHESAEGVHLTTTTLKPQNSTNHTDYYDGVNFNTTTNTSRSSHNYINKTSAFITDISRPNVTEANTSEIGLGLAGRPNESESLEAIADHFTPRSFTEVLVTETWCVWVLINMAYCCLILLGRAIQKLVFGELRVVEQQHLKDKFWNFVFYKFIFIFGVMNVQVMDEVVLWCAWFSMLGFLHLLAQLAKDRFEYLSFSPTTPTWTHARVLLLLMGIQTMCGCLLGICAWVAYMGSLNTCAFMAAEVILLGIRTLYVVTRYAIHLRDLHFEGVWENRATFVYYSEFLFELAALTVDFAHHLHMLLWGNIFLSMASLVICMQLRYLFHEFQRRIRRHKNYRRVVSTMEARFPLASSDQLEQNNDDCAICWDKMETACKLPCGHLFHVPCLRSWLEQDTSCPTCRTSLMEPPADRPPGVIPPGPGGDTLPPGQEHIDRPGGNQTTNHFFHFDGSRYASWLPSFSVEVTHTHVFGNVPPTQPVQTSQLDTMARQVYGMFPNISMEAILEDLRVTRSMEFTIENILEGRLQPTPSHLRNQSRAITGDSAEESSQSGSSQTQSSEEGSDSDDSDLDQNTTDTQEQADTEESSRSAFSFINNDEESSLPDLSSDEAQEEASALQESAMKTSGSRFSKSPMERENMLTDRKKDLLQNARRRYLTKYQVDTHQVSQDDDIWQDDGNQGDDPDPQRRRELAYQAARRRMLNNPE